MGQKLLQIVKKIDWKTVLLLIILAFFVVSAIGSGIQAAYAPEKIEAGMPREKIRSNCILTLLQCILGIVSLFLPKILEKIFKIRIPAYMQIGFFAFLFCAIYLGEAQNFYYYVPYWDTMLHTFSGVILTALGFSILDISASKSKDARRFSPLLAALFAFCFSLATSVIWETYEFTIDGLFGLNMQKFATVRGVPFEGREALMDTMKDIIVHMIGALLATVGGYIALKRRKKTPQMIRDEGTQAGEDGPLQ